MNQPKFRKKKIKKPKEKTNNEYYFEHLKEIIISTHGG